MQIAEKVAIVTGGGAGIGAALAHALSEAGASVVVADLDAESATSVAAQISAAGSTRALSFGGDVSDPEVLEEIIGRAEAELGPVDIFFANAGTTAGLGLDTPDSQWDIALGVNVLAHVRAARILVPKWVERGGGYFVSTASAAGLLTQIGSATYSVSKHAAVGFAEWLSVTYGDQGVAVSCLCPMGVETKLLRSGFQTDQPGASVAASAVTSAGAVLSPAEVATAVLAAMEEEKFLILPHPEVLDFYRNKGSDYDRWIGGMRRYQRHLMSNP
ncbi:MAG: dehydrogenase [Gordonia sp.]|nr:dehydrogenase [Gordonia sp. (in: high G+C Gram-positive bacteria)]